MFKSKGKAKKANPQSSQKPTEGGSRIQPQSAQSSTDDQTRFFLWCHVASPDHPSTFKINVKITQDVDDLKMLILEKGVDAKLNDITLWKLDGALKLKPAKTLADRLKSSSVPRRELEEPSETVLDIFPEQPEKDHLHLFVELPVDQHPAKKARLSGSIALAAAETQNNDQQELSEDLILTKLWIALKNSSKFFDSTRHEFQEPGAGYVLRMGDSSPMFASPETSPVSSIFVRACYITWFDLFLNFAGQQPTGKFALSSTPGCGKTFATTFIFKMACTDPLLCDKAILYQFKNEFFHIQSDRVFRIDLMKARVIAMLPTTFYILDGFNAEPLNSDCLTLFISSPRGGSFKDWHVHMKITPLYFPVWSLDELRDCHLVCYPSMDPATIDDRYRRYGGVARYVFWPEAEEPPSIEGVIADTDARKSIRAVGEPSQLFPSSHMLLHLSVDESMHFQHVVLASRYIGVCLFSKYFQETLDNMKSMLGAGGALAGHLFECYVHFLLENGRDEPLSCRSLEGDGRTWELPLPRRQVETFDKVPQTLHSGQYYVPLATNFPAIDALTTNTGLQYCVTLIHPIKGVQVINQLAQLYPDNKLPLLFVVPESIAAEFKRQDILTAKGQVPAKPPHVLQSVVGLPLGIDISPHRVMS